MQILAVLLCCVCQENDVKVVTRIRMASKTGFMHLNSCHFKCFLSGLPQFERSYLNKSCFTLHRFTMLPNTWTIRLLNTMLEHYEIPQSENNRMWAECK